MIQAKNKTCRTDLYVPLLVMTSPQWPTPRPLGHSESWSGYSRGAEQQDASHGSERIWLHTARSVSQTLQWTEDSDNMLNKLKFNQLNAKLYIFLKPCIGKNENCH